MVNNITSNPNIITSVIGSKYFVELVDSFKNCPKTIIYMLDKLENANIEDIKNSKANLESNGLESVTSVVGIENSSNLIANLTCLDEFGYQVDAEQMKKDIAVLSIDSNIFRKNLETLKEYKVSIAKQGSKIALYVLANDPTVLISKLDSYIETLSKTDVDKNVALTQYADVPERITHLEENQISEYRKSNGQFRTLVEPIQFKDSFSVDLDKVLISKEDNNACVSATVGEEIIISNEIVELSEDDKMIYEGLIQLLDSKEITKAERTYEVDGVKISAPKFDRNLKALIASKTDLSNEAMLLAALLYNSQKSEEEIKKVAQAMGFSLAMGGK